MKYLILVPFALQAIFMMVDEFYFHRRRGLGRWERIGHPLDTLSVLLFYLYLILVPPSGVAVLAASGLGIVSSALITKDEFIHSRECSAGEHWLHSVLFVLHPLVLLSALMLWPLRHLAVLPADWGWLATFRGLESLLPVFFALSSLMILHQIVFWNLVPLANSYWRKGRT